MGIITLSQVKQSIIWVECVGKEGQRGKLMSYTDNIPVNLQGCDLLQKWNNQISIPPVSESNHNLTHFYEKML